MKTHLFVDDYLIDSLEYVKRVWHRPERHPDNTILTGTEPWDRWFIEVDRRPALYDEETREFKMWDLASLSDEAISGGHRYKVCYAVSEDGTRWDRPTLGFVEWDGSRQNNILPSGETWMRRCNVIKDPIDSDPDRRFKMTYVDVIGGGTVGGEGRCAAR